MTARPGCGDASSDTSALLTEPYLRRVDGQAPMPSAGHAIIIFDGVCLLCSHFIHFVMDHDASERFVFCPLQSEVGEDLVSGWGLKNDLSTIVVIDEDGAHVRSRAALRVLRHLGRPWSFLYCFTCLPTPLTDVGYRIVASLRYRLFGREDGATCRRLTKDMRRRFLAV